MKESLKQITSTLLAFCMLALLTPAMPAYAAETVTVTLPENIIEEGQSAALELKNSKGDVIADFSGYTFDSSNPEIAVVDARGNVTGVSIGRAVITVSGAGVGKVEIPIVGENLLEKLDNSSIAWRSKTDTTKAWWLRKELLSKVYDYMSDESRYAVNVETAAGSLSNADSVLRLTSKSVPASGITSQYIYLISVDYKGIPTNKIYEFSGWACAENVPEGSDTLHNAWQAKVFYYTGNTYTLRKNPSEATAVTPFAGKSGNQGWTYFTTNPIANDGLPSSYSLHFRASLSGGKTVADGGWQGDILFSNLSLHEVEYDKLEFLTSSSESEVALQKGKTVSTTVKHYSTTGREITYRLTDANKIEANIQVTYSSSDEGVATVSEDGVISAVGNGSAYITASATIGGVTRSETICVAVNESEISTDIFGTGYAYISHTKDGDCFVTVLAGIESLNYREVGFELLGDGISNPEIGTTNAYKNIAVKYNDGTQDIVQSLSPSDFGVPDSGYIFYRQQSVDAEFISKGLVLRAYAVDLDGNKIYGDYVTISKIAD